MSDQINITEFCAACSTHKFDGQKCTAYSPEGQRRWIVREGWCPLGNTGPKMPESLKVQTKGKRRVGQQKQARRR
jgi:hypothetical protein